MQNEKHEASVQLEFLDLEADGVLVEKLRGREAVSQAFEFHLRLKSTQVGAVDDDDLLGAQVCIVLERNGQAQRRIFGTVYRVERIFDRAEGFDTFDIEVGPALGCMRMVTTQEVYLNMSVPDIIKQKLAVANFDAEGKDFDMLLDPSNYPRRDFVVQYQESDFDFICRLAESVGIAFYFEHGARGGDGSWDRLASKGYDRVVFVDQVSQFADVPDGRTLVFNQTGLERNIYDLRKVQRVVPGLVWLRDYNYSRPELDLSAHEAVDLDGKTMGALIEYGCNMDNEKELQRLARVRVDEAKAKQTTYRGTSDVMRLASGSRCDLDPAEVAPHGMTLLEVEHEFQQGLLMHGETDAAKPIYKNSFSAIPGHRPYCPPRRTPKPTISGVLTGFVRTAADHEHGNTCPDPPMGAIDDRGRYVVALHFDTPGRDATHQGGIEGAQGIVLASIPIRMLQPSVGSNYGMHLPLRAGTEVKIAFENGDPDRPVIVGAVANGTVPNVVNAADANKGRIKSQSGIVIELSDA
jgi:type VI secretion system secreted protein VgrG